MVLLFALQYPLDTPTATSLLKVGHQLQSSYIMLASANREPCCWWTESYKFVDSIQKRGSMWNCKGDAIDSGPWRYLPCSRLQDVINMGYLSLICFTVREEYRKNGGTIIGRQNGTLSKSILLEINCSSFTDLVYVAYRILTIFQISWSSSGLKNQIGLRSRTFLACELDPTSTSNRL